MHSWILLRRLSGLNSHHLLRALQTRQHLLSHWVPHERYDHLIFVDWFLNCLELFQLFRLRTFVYNGLVDLLLGYCMIHLQVDITLVHLFLLGEFTLQL